MKALPVVVVALLVVATVGAGAMVPSAAEPQPSAESSPVAPQVETEQATEEPPGEPTNVLAMPNADIEQSDLRRHHVDLGPAVGFDSAATTDTLATGSIERELATADDPAAQLTEEVEAIEATTEQLRQQESNAIAQFAAGVDEPRETLETLALVGQTADRLQDRRNLIEEQLDTASLASETESNLDERLTRVDYELRMLNGPVRSHAASVLGAERPADRISIQAAEDSIELTAIADGEYLRETYRLDRRTGSGNIDADIAETVVEQNYPVFWEQRGTGTWSISGPSFVSEVTMDIDIGELQMFIDGTTRQQFIEHQRLSLDAVVASEQTTIVQDGLEVSVNQTYIGGPLNVDVADAETGEPVDATVRIGQGDAESETVGETQDGEVVWTVTPRDEFRITVLGEDDSAAFVELTPQPAEVVL